MKNNLFKKIITSILIFSYLFIIMGTVGDLVLCIEQDGHISIKLASSACCKSSDSLPLHNDRGPQISQTLANKALDDSHCTSCIDIPIAKYFKNEFVKISCRYDLG